MSTDISLANTLLMSSQLVLWNLFIVQSIRMQNIDTSGDLYLRKSFKAMLTKEGVTPIYKGVNAMFWGSTVQWLFALKATSLY